MRIAFISQRYGSDVHGGAEYLCRMWAEHLAHTHHVEIITTCARDYLTWADFYPPGIEHLNGVRIQRFAVDQPRDLPSFDNYSHTIFGQQHTRAQEIAWMRQQGPYSSALLHAIAAQRDHIDLFIFMTYLYATTYFGLPLVRDKALLTPTAHDEPPIHLRIFRDVFAAPRAILYCSPTEQTLVQRLFRPTIPGHHIGIGVELPAHISDEEDTPPTLLYIGRIHPSKGCDQLHDYFVRYRQTCAHPLRLILAGRADMALPEHPDITLTGFVSDAEKQRLLQQCSLLVMPSAYESLSIVCLEAWAAGKPTLVNGTPVLREQTLRSGGGLFYTTYDEFATSLDLLLHRKNLRRTLGQQGRHFVEQWYNWSNIEQRLTQALLHTAEKIKT